MLVEADALLASLGLPGSSVCHPEPLGERKGAPERIRIDLPGRDPLVAVVRRPEDPDRGLNHAAVSEALARAGFAHAPALLAVIDGATVERWEEGASALAFVPPDGSCEAAIDALAALHALPLREGLDWERSAADLIPRELPLHRLGFAAAEREAAAPALARAHDALIESPFGFAHRRATADHILLAPNRATIINFARAGFGPQLFDVAAFLLTAGLDANARATLAGRYANARSLPERTIVDLTDLAGVLWGFETLLELPRRLVETLGDEAESSALHTAAMRIDAGIRKPAGEHPAANAIRGALWQL